MDKKEPALKALVIGGGGFIGVHLVTRLVISGRQVTVLDRSALLDRFLHEQITYVVGDFSDKKIVDELVAEHDEVIHLAYATVPNTSFDDPLADLVQNLRPAVQLFEIVAKHGARLMLVSSGGTVYGEAQDDFISEDHPTHPISPYGVTKLTLEKYAYLYAVTRGLNVVCVRPANPYGEGQRPFSGQGFIATAMAMALQHKAISIFGSQGTVRDYIYIDDLIEGLLFVLNGGECSTVYNIGSSIGRSNLDVIQAMRPLLADIGIDVQVNIAPARSFDVQRNVLDCTRLRQLGWSPRTAFDDGLQRTLTWLQEYLR
jgi:UDP-glucose 4-epimerase